MNLITVRNIKKSYGTGKNKVDVLNGMSFCIEKGELVTIVGKSGSGKTTLLNIVAGIDTPDEGYVEIADTYITSLNEKQKVIFRRRNIGFIFQEYNLLSVLNAYDNIALPFTLDRVKKVDHEYIKRVMKSLKIWDKRNSYPSELSGGQRQRVAIARALAIKPMVILADEPTGNLDSASSKEILQILKNMHEQGKTVILITHDNGIAAQARRVVRIMDGKIESDTINENYGKEEYVKNQLDV